MAAGFHQATSDVDSVVGIQFGIFSPEEIVKRSVVEVLHAATYDGNEPKISGLFDPRMGVLDNGKTCRSCGQTNHNCPGHFGHYRLARPVYFIQFMNQIKTVLKCICVRCGKLLIDKARHSHIASRRGEHRWALVKEACDKIKRCGQETEDGCGTLVPNTIAQEGIARIYAEWKELPVAGEEKKTQSMKQVLEVEYVLRLFRQILDEDVDFMGLSRYWCRPDWMVCTVLPIPPPQVRPSVVQDNNQRSEDDITHKLFEIIRANKRLQDQINKNANKNMIDELTTLLQYHVATLVDNKIPGVAPSAQRGGRPLKSIQQRIGSKEGRVRYNIQGKRVEQSARSVITGDPNISIAEVGVPKKIAMNLTRPEVVTRYNIQRLYKFVQNGADVYPGAKSIVSGKDGHMISLRHVNTKEIKLRAGDTVHRHLMDGDIILFNRQPTLHRMSMMGHRVRVLDHNTFRLNVQVTRPYNADFDGDEMNAHIPQSYEATAELQELAAVPNQMIRPGNGTPGIAVVQDALAGSYLATQPNNKFTRREYMNMMMKNKMYSSLPSPRSETANGKKARYTGQQILGSLFSPITIEMENKGNKVKIHEGDFLEGVLDKPVYNSPGKGIIHTTYNDYGPKATVELLDGIQNMMETYLIMKGFSVGISDLVADKETMEGMETYKQKCKTAVDALLLKVHMGLFTNNSGKSNQQEFEDQAFVELNKGLSEVGKLAVNKLPSDNRLMIMIRSGSKGDANNPGQMIGCLGQQNQDGRRIPYGFTERTLPHYKMYDDSAEARGFVSSSFMKGLSPQEFFFHAMSGREGLIDTAVKTADTGYTQRQLIKAMEDLMLHHDGTVRDATGKVVQFRYGEDGLNSTRLEATPLKTYLPATNVPWKLVNLEKLTDKEIESTFGMEAYEGPEDEKDTLKDFAKQVKADRDMYVKDVSASSLPVEVNTAVNLDRMLLNIKIKFGYDKQPPSERQVELTPSEVIADIEKLIQRTQPFNRSASSEKNYDSINRIWATALRLYLAPHIIITKENFSRMAWNALCEVLLVKNWKAWAVPGELVGIVAAQSIGEPATQMTLNTFHQAGVASKSAVTRGVPRLKELLRLTKNPKAVSLTIYLKKGFREEKDHAREVTQDLELTLLRDLVKTSAIYYDPEVEGEKTILEEDRELLDFYDAFTDMESTDRKDLSKWVLRLEFDREKMFNKNIHMDDVAFVVKEKLSASSDLVYSDFNSSKLIMRIRPSVDSYVMGDQLAAIKKYQISLLNNTIVRGLAGLRAVNFRQHKTRFELQELKDETTNRKDKAWKEITQYVLETDGSNFLNVLQHPAVDGTMLYSTNIYDIYQFLGVEAARNALYQEISTLFSQSDINYRHLGLLCDVMAHSGKLMSVDRYGINKQDSGPLAKACFEETEKVLLKAALFGEMDPVTGVSANIMTGQTIRAGTAYSQVLLDEQKFFSLMSKVELEQEEEDDEIVYTDENVKQSIYDMPTDPCATIEERMNLVVPKSIVEQDDGDDQQEEDLEFTIHG
jgi:DNA-directed RNA polymerase II subunit RPB1